MFVSTFPSNQILFERVTFDQQELREATRIIDKDVPRTNRDLSYFQWVTESHCCYLAIDMSQQIVYGIQFLFLDLKFVGVNIQIFSFKQLKGIIHVLLTSVDPEKKRKSNRLW